MADGFGKGGHASWAEGLKIGQLRFYDRDQWGDDVDYLPAELGEDWGQDFWWQAGSRRAGWSGVGQQGWRQGGGLGVEADAGRCAFGLNGGGEPV